MNNKERTRAEKRVQYLCSKATGGRDCCALPRMTSVFLHEVNYINSYISTGNEIQHDSLCKTSEFLAYEISLALP